MLGIYSKLVNNPFKARAGGSDSDSDDGRAKATSSTTLLYGSSGTAVEKGDQNATAIREIDTDLAVDQR